jgi:hypothetical protein
MDLSNCRKGRIFSTGTAFLVVTPDGITFIRDEVKCPLWTIPASLEFMRQAAARGKTLGPGTISGFPGAYSP